MAAITSAFCPTACRPDLPSGCPRCGEEASLVCCDIEHPENFLRFIIPPLKAERALGRSRVEPVKLGERTPLDMKLTDALENWREETTKIRYGEAALLDFGPSLIMTARILDRIVDCVHYNKISSVQDLARETRWDEISCYGDEVLALIQSIHPPAPTSTTQSSESTGSTGRKVRCSSCGQLGHNGVYLSSLSFSVSDPRGLSSTQLLLSTQFTFFNAKSATFKFEGKCE